MRALHSIAAPMPWQKAARRIARDRVFALLADKEILRILSKVWRIPRTVAGMAFWWDGRRVVLVREDLDLEQQVFVLVHESTHHRLGSTWHLLERRRFVQLGGRSASEESVKHEVRRLVQSARRRWRAEAGSWDSAAIRANPSLNTLLEYVGT